MAMVLSPWPSPTMARYQAKMFALRTVAFVFVLVGLLQVLDLLSESEKILAVPANGNGELWQYVKWRLPQLIDTFLPFAVLLGALVTWASLATSSEITVMKGAGLSPHQILLPLMLAALGFAAIHFAFAEIILPQTNAALDDWQKADYQRLPDAPGTARFGEWEVGGGDVLSVGMVEGRGAATVLLDVEVYRREGAALASVISGARAVPDGDGWRIEDAEAFSVERGVSIGIGDTIVAEGVSPERFTRRTPDPDDLPSRPLARAIDDLEDSGRSTDSLKTALFQKFAAPLSAILMPLLGAVAGFGLARSGQMFVRAVIGMVLGFAYFVADNAMLAMGEFGAAPPLIAAWGPFLLFFLVGEAVLFHTEE
ncbi:MAG: LPS export ABC transporter permease LptG [Pseudomonadota bacterium]